MTEQPIYKDQIIHERDLLIHLSSDLPDNDQKMYRAGIDDLSRRLLALPTKKQESLPLGKTHPSHKMRYSDSSFVDEVCDICGEGDPCIGNNPRLSEPCKGTWK